MAMAMAGVNTLDPEKQIEQSNLYRDKGNTHFLKNTVDSYLCAVTYYNYSICFAPTHSDTFYRALQNRALVYYRLGMYDVALDNMKLIYQYGQCPPSILRNLKLLEIECRRFIQEGKLPEKYEPIEPQLSLPAKEDDPCVAKCLEMRDHDIITNRDLNVGEIISILEPLSVVELERHLYHRCEYCCRENSRNLIPCPGCTSVMFCGENCLGKAMETFHKYECKSVDFRHRTLTRIEMLALRAMMTGLSFFDTIDEFLDAVVNAFIKKPVKFNDKTNSMKDSYLKLLSLFDETRIIMPRPDGMTLMFFCEGIFELRNVSSTKEYSLYAAMLKSVAEQHLLLAERGQAHLLTLSDCIVNNRMHGLDSKKIPSRTCASICQFKLTISHSCIPNVIMTNAGITQILSVVRPIKAGDPLLICTNKQFFEIGREARWSNLKFECQCEACRENYPLLEDLPGSALSYPTVIDYQISKLLDFDRIGALNHYQSTVDILQRNDSDMPCKKLVEYHLYYANIMSTKYCDDISLILRNCKHIIKQY